MLNVKALKTFDQKNKTVLIRFDLNIPLNKEASTISDRITRIKNPIQNLLNKNNKNESLFLNHLNQIVENKMTNAHHMINKFSKENLETLYDK